MRHEYANHFPSLALKRIITFFLKKKTNPKNKKHNWKPNSYFAAEFEECFKHANVNLKGGGERSDGSALGPLNSAWKALFCTALVCAVSL